ncbi:MAG: copper resistance system multicopper oxidase [Vicinamibacterales bacterium]
MCLGWCDSSPSVADVSAHAHHGMAADEQMTTTAEDAAPCPPVRGIAVDARRPLRIGRAATSCRRRSSRACCPPTRGPSPSSRPSIGITTPGTLAPLHGFSLATPVRVRALTPASAGAPLVLRIDTRLTPSPRRGHPLDQSVLVTGPPPHAVAQAHRPRACVAGRRDRESIQMPCSQVSRRRFVQGLAMGGVALGFRPQTPAAAGRLGPVPQVLSGTDITLEIAEMPLAITGRPRVARAINGSVPGPLLRLREGDTVTLRVRNRLDEETSIHWHGLILPANMDGVPGLSFHGIHPGDAYDYRFTLRQHGTYWYHSHSGFQEQSGVYAPLVIEPREPEPFACDREHVVMLTDWTDQSPERLFRLLKKQSDYFNWRQRTVPDFVRDVRELGLADALADRLAWGDMRMSASDLADVSGATYTYLMNGQPPEANWTGLFEPGERVRLRLINGSAMSYFDVRIPGVRMTVVAADGQHVRPVTVDELRIAVAETFDVIVEPSGQDAFTIFAQAFDRTGFAAGTLAVRRLRGRCPLWMRARC